MARFESKGRSNPKRGSSNRSPYKSRGDYDDGPRGRDSGRGFSRDRHEDRRDVQMTQVTCSSCGEECEVPFKPTSDKPVYCSNCFSKKDKRGSDRHPNRDLDIVNEKLDKIMKALKIE